MSGARTSVKRANLVVAAARIGGFTNEKNDFKDVLLRAAGPLLAGLCSVDARS